MNKFRGKKVKYEIKRFITSIVAMMLLISMCFGMVSCSGNGSIVVKNADGENVFGLTVEEYLEQYSSKLGGNLSVDDFEKDIEDEDIFYYLNTGVGIFIISTDVEEPCYVNGISFSYTPEKADVIVDGVYGLVGALYPEDDSEEISKTMETAFNEGSTIYKNVDISVDGNDNGNSQFWKINPEK